MGAFAFRFAVLSMGCLYVKKCEWLTVIGVTGWSFIFGKGNGRCKFSVDVPPNCCEYLNLIKTKHCMNRPPVLTYNALTGPLEGSDKITVEIATNQFQIWNADKATHR